MAKSLRTFSSAFRVLQEPWLVQVTVRWPPPSYHARFHPLPLWHILVAVLMMIVVPCVILLGVAHQDHSSL